MSGNCSLSLRSPEICLLQSTADLLANTQEAPFDRKESEYAARHHTTYSTAQCSMGRGQRLSQPA